VESVSQLGPNISFAVYLTTLLAYILPPKQQTSLHIHTNELT